MIDLEQRGPEKKNFENRLALIYIFFVFLFSAIIFQTYSLQVSSFIDYEEANELYDDKRKSFINESRILDVSLMNSIFPGIIEFKDVREGIKDSLN